MRQKRAKAYKKQMATYERNFGFRHPYQVLYTADFLEAAEGFRLDPVGGVKRTVQGEVKTMISQCCIKQLYDEKANSSIRLAKTMERRRCGHVEAPETPYDCVVACVGTRNKNRYIVATNDQKLREQLRNVPGLPLIYINRSVMILEPPSPATLMVKESREAAKLGVSQEEAAVLGKRKRGTPTTTSTTTLKMTTKRDGPDESGSEDDDDDDMEVSDEQKGKRRKKKGVPGPNPLSQKKAKRTAPTTNTNTNVSTISTTDTIGAVDAEGGDRNRRKRKHKRKTTTGTAAAATTGESTVTTESTHDEE